MPAERAIKASLDAACGASVSLLRNAPSAYTRAVTAAAIAAFLSSMAEAGVSLAHMHDWHDLAEAASRDQ